jgi:hypothetical protein
LSSYFRTCRLVPPPPTGSHFDLVTREVGRTLVGRYRTADKVKVYNLAKVLGEDHLSAIVDCQQAWNGPKELMVSPLTMQLTADLPAHAAWLKASIIVAQLLSPPEKSVYEGSINVGQAIPDATLKALRKVDAKILERMSAHIHVVMTAYSQESLAPVPANLVSNGRILFLSKSADAVSKLKAPDPSQAPPITGEEDCEKRLRRAESRLREHMTEHGRHRLPDRVLGDD